MSQHYYKTICHGKPVRIQIGWDKPLQGFYLVVLDLNNDVYLYSNLEETESHPPVLDSFLDKLKVLGIELPDEIISAVLSDKQNNAVNKLTDWGASPEFEE